MAKFGGGRCVTNIHTMLPSRNGQKNTKLSPVSIRNAIFLPNHLQLCLPRFTDTSLLELHYWRICNSPGRRSRQQCHG